MIMSIYRLRTCENLLGEFKELESQTIFLADSTSFNDPLEDFVYLKYKGDRILWENMFKEFLVAMEYQMYTAPLYSEDMFDEFMKGNINGPKTGPYFKHKDYSNRIRKITDRFFDYKCVGEWLEYLQNRDEFINDEQLISILSVMSCFATESILYIFEECTSAKNFYSNFLSVSQKLLSEVETNSSSILIEIKKSQKEDELLNRLNLDFQSNMAARYSFYDLEIKKISNYYFLFDFPVKFVNELKDFVYYRWYAASFMKEPPKRMDLWSNYAKDHTGVCLIFKNVEHLKCSGVLHLQCGYVEYNNDIVTIDFFKRMWVLNEQTLLNEWYTDRCGNKSPSFEQAGRPTEEERNELWSSVAKIKYRKNKDWEAENEIRFTIDNNWIDVTDPARRLLTYDFNSLEGIVFGIRTSVLDKARIFKTISSKCKAHKRNSFKFYQARYDKLKGELVYDEMITLEKYIK